MSPQVKADLLFCARTLAQTLEYEIRKDHRAGDDEGARMKAITLNLVRSAIYNAELEKETA